MLSILCTFTFNQQSCPEIEVCCVISHEENEALFSFQIITSKSDKDTYTHTQRTSKPLRIKGT